VSQVFHVAKLLLSGRFAVFESEDAVDNDGGVPPIADQTGIDFVGPENTELAFSKGQPVPAQVGLVVDEGGCLETFG